MRALPLLLALASFASHARAQDSGVCTTPVEIGPLEVTPAVGAEGVPRNAVVKVRYSDGYFAGATQPTETVTLTGPSGPVSGRLELAGTEVLYFVPSAPLAALTPYTGAASGSAFPFEFSFVTSGSTDSTPPTFGDPRGASGFAVDSSPAPSDCFPAGSRRIRLTFPSAVDLEGPTTSIEYDVYVTRGEGLAAPELVARVRDFASTLTTVGFVVDPVLGSRPLCVVAVAVDGLDRGTAWPAPVCFDPANGFGFAPLCSARPGGRTSPPAGLGFALACVVVARIRRRR